MLGLEVKLGVLVNAYHVLRRRRRRKEVGKVVVHISCRGGGQVVSRAEEVGGGRLQGLEVRVRREMTGGEAHHVMSCEFS